MITVEKDVSSVYESLLMKTGYYDDYKNSLKFQIIGNIEARISKISNTGSVKIDFSANL